MACGGCAERRGLIGAAASAAVRGAWSEAAQAAGSAVVSAKVDVISAKARVAQAAAAVLAGRAR